MNTAQQTARVGLFFLLGLALTWVTWETLSDGKLFKQTGYTLIAGFENLKELKQGDEVRMADGNAAGNTDAVQNEAHAAARFRSADRAGRAWPVSSTRRSGR